MTPDRLSRRAALSMTVLVVALLMNLSTCTKQQPPPQPAVTESVTQSTATETSATDTAATMAVQASATETTGTAAKALVTMDKKTIEKMTHPVVTIDPKTFKVDQKEVHLFDFEPEAGNPHQPSTRAVRIYWRTTTGQGNLELNFLQKTCVSNEVCKKGAGECSATALPRPKPGTRCEYTLKLDGNKVDPVIIVDPCCP